MSNRLFSTALMLLALSGCFNGSVYSAKPLQQQDLSESLVVAADISRDGSYTLLTDGQQLCLWQNQSLSKQYACIEGEAAKHTELVGISPGNQYFYSSNRLSVNLYALASGQRLASWNANNNIINDIAISEQANKLLIGFRNGQSGIIDIGTGQLTAIAKHRLDINSVALSQDGRLAITGSSDKTAVVWQLASQNTSYRFNQQSRVNHVALSADGKLGFIIDAINVKSFVDLQTGAEIAELDTAIRFIEFNDSVFSADNRYFLTGSPKQKIQLWRVDNGELVAEWQSYKVEGRDRASVLAVAFASNKEILSLTNDGMLERWSLPKGQ